MKIIYQRLCQMYVVFLRNIFFAMSVRENIYILELIQSYKIGHMVGGNRPCNASNDV
jgi:hypothetical protein